MQKNKEYFHFHFAFVQIFRIFAAKVKNKR